MEIKYMFLIKTNKQTFFCWQLGFTKSYLLLETEFHWAPQTFYSTRDFKMGFSKACFEEQQM